MTFNPGITSPNEGTIGMSLPEQDDFYEYAGKLMSDGMDQADSAPHAICLAALAATKSEM